MRVHVARMGEIINAHKTVVRKIEGKGTSRKT
jgi:hypothetical protein